MSGRMVVVVGAAGGCGTSTLASGLAVATARSGGEVTLIDLDLSGGDMAGAWGVPLERTLDDLATVAGSVGPDHLRRAAAHHECGAALLPAGVDAGARRTWDAPACAQLVRAAAESGTVVVDAGSGIAAGSGAVETAGAVVLVCPSNMSGARRARVIVDRWRAASLDDRLLVALVRGPAAPEVGPRAMERLLGAGIGCRVPWAPIEAKELLAGRWPAGRRRPLRQEIERLAQVIG